MFTFFYFFAMLFCYAVAAGIIYACRNDKYFLLKHLILVVVVGFIIGAVPILNMIVAAMILIFGTITLFSDTSDSNPLNKPAFKKKEKASP